MDNSSGVGVLDKAAAVLSALEAGPATLAQLVAATHLARPDDQERALFRKSHASPAVSNRAVFIASFALLPAQTTNWKA